MRRNIKIVLEYDGTDFVGWQRQPNGRTVQEEIENALQRMTGLKINVVGSGRTDSGVHARGQTANFFIDVSTSVADILRSLNGLTGDDIVIHSIAEVDEKFSARYSAKEREYKYYISHRSTAIDRRYCWQLGYELDSRAMNTASLYILGSHDFQSFCRVDSDVDHYVCNVFASEWQQHDEKTVFMIRANRFLHGMVRALVGTMVDVGRGFTTVEGFKTILCAKQRQSAGQSAPAQGLFLERVVY
jgi:tRNA pseudouridine38-40 synthase